jgi:hypothetical protein
MNWRFLLNNSARLIVCRVWLLVLFYHVDVFHQHTVIIQHSQDMATLVLAATCRHDYFITFMYTLHS